MSTSVFTKQQAQELKETIQLAESVGKNADPNGSHSILLRFRTERSNGTGSIESGTVTIPPSVANIVMDAITKTLEVFV